MSENDPDRIGRNEDELAKAAFTGLVERIGFNIMRAVIIQGQIESESDKDGLVIGLDEESIMIAVDKDGVLFKHGGSDSYRIGYLQAFGIVEEVESTTLDQDQNG